MIIKISFVMMWKQKPPQPFFTWWTPTFEVSSNKLAEQLFVGLTLDHRMIQVPVGKARQSSSLCESVLLELEILN
jgi:hypothetical protein